MIQKIAFTIFLLSITHLVCHSQTQPIYQDSQIDSLTVIGLENNYLLKAKEMEVGIAKQNLASTKKSWMSTFSFQVSTFRYSNTGTVTQVSAFNDLGVGLSIDLFTITSLNNRIKKAELEVVKNEMQYQNQLKIVKREYIQIYSAYLKATEQLKVFTEQEISQKELLQIVKDKLLRGEAKIEEYLLVEQRLHETKVAKIEAEVSAALAQHEMGLLINE
ncbi:TolC family protein [Flammeovirga pacifica]|uniref:Transporter n=1 Tax=Flammeovirga pacifica TaxID=915059 RepID=A0A1S1YT90_FLAPC|nr:TolC family protein [Flammeovirga pacifica]OHX64247.1 hypothetical protein NH26_21840 [Flammeovirga pacifica]